MSLVLRAALFTTVAPGALALGVPLLIVWATGAATGGPIAVTLGGALVAVGVAVYLWCVFDFITRGRGTPNPYDAPEHLVERGLYGWVRNPMYVGVTSVIVGEAVCFLSPILAVYAAAVLLAFHLRVIIYEEPTLDRLFGSGWEDYRARVPRWLPRVRPR